MTQKQFQKLRKDIAKFLYPERGSAKDRQDVLDCVDLDEIVDMFFMIWITLKVL